MPQFFHSRWNALARLSLFGGPLYLAAVASMAAYVVYSPYATGTSDPVDQPVPFSHEVHSGLLKLDCRYCHAKVEQAAFAGMPSTDVCMNCHTRVWTGLPAIEPVRASYETNIPLAWRRVHNLPDFAYFDHSIHVQKGYACVTCHGRVDRMDLVWQTETLYMQWCLECHREPARHIRPREYVFHMDWEFPNDPLELESLGRRLGVDPPPVSSEELQVALVKKYDIQRYTSCSICHQ